MTLADLKALADMGGALVFSVYVGWQVERIRATLDQLTRRIRVVEVDRPPAP